MLALAGLMEASRVFSSLLLLGALTLSCGSSDSGSGPGGTGGAGAVDPGGPLLDRPSGDEFDCSVSRPIAPLNMTWAGFSLVPGAQGAKLAAVLVDHNNIDPNQPSNSVTWSSLGPDGTLSSPTVVSARTNRFLSTVTAASGPEKSTIVWSETDGTSYSLNSVQVDASGAVVTPASVLATPSRDAEPKIVRAGSGYALLWLEGNDSSAKLSFGLLDETGKLASGPVVLAQGPYLAVGTIVSIGDHFVVSYADYQFRESGLVSRLLVLGADGNALGPPIAFENSAPTGFAPSAPNLFVRGNQVLAAWSTLSGSVETEDAATTIRVARFDANGARQGPMYDLQAPVKDREAVQPLWIEMGDDVGLLWADGSIIYICGGCVPNHSLKLVVLDGEKFTPQSKVLELVNPLPAGGLLSPDAVRTGDELLVVSTVTYHTSGEGASGTIRCVK
jgi:hypothetical protein